jgi:hypothetical protein
LEQSQQSLLFVEWIEDDPDTQFVAFQTRLEKGNKNVKKVLLCLIEMAKVRTPFHGTNWWDTGLSILIRHQIESVLTSHK